MGDNRYSDRSSILRKLILIGYSYFLKQKAAEEYMGGNITLSEGADMAEITLWEMEKFLVEGGFKSDYSIEDLDEEMKRLD